MVGAAGFEPATSCTPSKRASRATLRPDRNQNSARAEITDSERAFNHEYHVAADPCEARRGGGGCNGEGGCARVTGAGGAWRELPPPTNPSPGAKACPARARLS